MSTSPFVLLLPEVPCLTVPSPSTRTFEPPGLLRDTRLIASAAAAMGMLSIQLSRQQDLCGGFLQSPNTMLVEGNLFDGNSAGNSGGGLAIVGSGDTTGNSATVTGNTFVGNQVG